MKKIYWILPIALVLVINCASSGETRRSISASGNPEDIFFEREMDKEIDPVAVSVKEDLNSGSPKKYDIPDKSADRSGSFDEVGYSSWYGAKYQGKPTASGEPFDQAKLTAAHRTLPMGSIVKVQNLENNKEAMVRVNDRGPFVDGRIIDVSEKAADILDFKDKGIAKVGLTLVNKSGADKFEELDDGDLDEDLDLVEGSNKPEKLLPKKQDTASTVATNRPRGYTVQVGVFKEAGRAQNYKSMMSKEYGQKVFVFSRPDGHVVQLGDFSSRDEAERLKNKLRYDGIECFIPAK
ncbi:MAG: septal ring lytic transglycosylase RlpA family protein [Leptospira sp.]|nr:septal ring lytic transglycosylase RlpA family protein [Leptospira sp.]